MHYFFQWRQLRRWSPTTPSSWGSVCGLTWSRLAAFHCSRSALQREISVSSSHIHQHISHVHYAVYLWLFTNGHIVCIYSYLLFWWCVYVCVCFLFLSLSTFAPLFVANLYFPPRWKFGFSFQLQMVWVSAQWTNSCKKHFLYSQHSGLDNWYILSLNKCRDFTDIIYAACDVLTQLNCLSWNFIMHYHAYFFLTEADFLRLFLLFSVFSRKMERD